MVPLVVVILWKPYEMYCLSRLDTTAEVPKWCWDEWPNIYSYIQKQFWQVGFGEFLNRPWYLTATSVFTNQLFFYMVYRQLKAQGFFSFATLNLCSAHKPQSEKGFTDVFSNKCFVPHFWVLFINLITVLLFANTEINSRVASTCLFYYVGLSQIVIETYNELKEGKKLTFKHLMVFMTLTYNTVVMLLNLLLFSVGIGFV